MTQHRVLQRSLPISRLIVVRERSLQTVLQLPLCSVGSFPFAEQKGEVAIERKAVGSAFVLQFNNDRPLIYLIGKSCWFEEKLLLLGSRNRATQLDGEVSTRF